MQQVLPERLCPLPLLMIVLPACTQAALCEKTASCLVCFLVPARGMSRQWVIIRNLSKRRQDGLRDVAMHTASNQHFGARSRSSVIRATPCASYVHLFRPACKTAEHFCHALVTGQCVTIISAFLRTEAEAKAQPKHTQRQRTHNTQHKEHTKSTQRTHEGHSRPRPTHASKVCQSSTAGLSRHHFWRFVTSISRRRHR